MYFIVSLFLATGFYMTTFKKSATKCSGMEDQGTGRAKAKSGE